MEGVHEGLHGGAVKDDHVLDGLLLLAEDVDDVLGQLAAEDGRDGGDLAADVLQEAAQELGAEGLAGQAEGLVLDGGHLGEGLEVLPIARDAPTLGLHELPQGAEAAQRGGDVAQAAFRGRVLAGQGGRVAGEVPRRVELALGDGLDLLGALLLGLDVDDGAGAGLLLGLRGDVADVALDDVVVLDEVAEDEAVHAVGAGGVELAPVDARGRVDQVERVRVQVRGDDDVKRAKVAGPLGLGPLDVGVHLHAGVELLHRGEGDLGAVLADDCWWCCCLAVLALAVVVAAIRGQEELGAEVRLGDEAVVEDGEGTDAGEDKVLCDFCAECFQGDEEDVGTLDLGLGGHAPEADLAVIEGNVV